MPGQDEWLTIAQAEDTDEVRERILTGYRDGKPFTPYVPTVAWPAPSRSVLDFGCGLGRNFPFLETVADRVTGFDLPPMVARCRELGVAARVTLSDDWSSLRQQRFDVVYAALVLQHVDTDRCREYLRDLARMTPVVYLLSRSDTDFGQNLFELVAESGCYVPAPCVAVDHDPDTNQLRVLGTLSFDQVCRAAPGGHYETLLRVAATVGAVTNMDRPS